MRPLRRSVGLIVKFAQVYAFSTRRRFVVDSRQAAPIARARSLPNLNDIHGIAAPRRCPAFLAGLNSHVEFSGGRTAGQPVGNTRVSGPAPESWLLAARWSNRSVDYFARLVTVGAVGERSCARTRQCAISRSSFAARPDRHRDDSPAAIRSRSKVAPKLALPLSLISVLMLTHFFVACTVGCSDPEPPEAIARRPKHVPMAAPQTGRTAIPCRFPSHRQFVGPGALSQIAKISRLCVFLK